MTIGSDQLDAARAALREKLRNPGPPRTITAPDEAMEQEPDDWHQGIARHIAENWED